MGSESYSGLPVADVRTGIGACSWYGDAASLLCPARLARGSWRCPDLRLLRNSLVEERSSLAQLLSCQRRRTYAEHWSVYRDLGLRTRDFLFVRDPSAIQLSDVSVSICFEPNQQFRYRQRMTVMIFLREITAIRVQEGHLLRGFYTFCDPSCRVRGLSRSSSEP